MTEELTQILTLSYSVQTVLGSDLPISEQDRQSLDQLLAMTEEQLGQMPQDLIEQARPTVEDRVRARNPQDLLVSIVQFVQTLNNEQVETLEIPAALVFDVLANKLLAISDLPADVTMQLQQGLQSITQEVAAIPPELQTQMRAVLEQEFGQRSPQDLFDLMVQMFGQEQQ
ncbi:MAG: hypothetical protein WCA07_16390 [Gloeobacterales cyanobacterium]